SLTLNLTGGGLKYGGVLYSVFKDGTHTYYDFNDVAFDDSNKYVTVKSGAQSLNLVNGEYYAVFSGVAEGSASVKYLSIVATPEPGTATLSLIALVGLVARRRRRAA
ncbi:MAG: PEP-CTERM sorting domain-containing protein, partial [Akkermansia sp.]